MSAPWRMLKQSPLLVLSPVLAFVPLLALWLADVLHLVAGRRRQPSTPQPRRIPESASVVIPNWNGRDLLEKYIPSIVEALKGNPANEILVVDNASEDGSAEFLRQHFPSVKVLALEKNYGFGGGSNRGFAAASNDIVVLLNSDMRVAPDFLAPLLEGFHDDHVFAVSCQIFFSDPNRKREETGLTQAWWSNGKLGVRHRIEDEVTGLYPCFYGGGGSCAFDRHKFLELGGFDHLLAPFYLEDTDIGYMAWKRGWKVYYQPNSHVWHEHRGTIGRKFSQAYIQSVLHKNFLLFAWKNMHEPARLASHFVHAWADAIFSYLAGESPERATLPGMWRAFLQFPGAMISRWKARSLAVVSDTEAFRRPMGGYFHDRFRHRPSGGPPRVLFVSPYPIYPPTHGGGVFMYGTAKALATRTSLHLVVIIDEEWQREQHDPLVKLCASASFLKRPDHTTFAPWSIVPHSVRELALPDLEWIIHRDIYLHRIDVVQLEYTNLGQYAFDFRSVVVALFEHDVYFQSIGRALRQPGSQFRKISAGLEYLRAIRYELRMLPKVDHVQVCSRENRDYLLGFLPQLASRMDDTLRAGIDTTQYALHEGPREPYTMLFLGSFSHLPNQEALDWFARQVLPMVIEKCPRAKLVIIGSNPPPRHSLPVPDSNVEMRGFVEDLQEPLRRYAVFVCPILTGSGVRVKLLEAFAAGIPVVSTRIGAEGLTGTDGDICALADTPGEFAARIIELFASPQASSAMQHRARSYVTRERDITGMTERLIARYRQLLDQ
ncbi:MAG: glycosyltransferase [Bryobacteraceae bacterium]|nr:glycosyltransferase [Bryobacteraceae bacterium]